MSPADLARHLEKAEHALDWTLKHLTLQNEANAALHMNGKVFYSPLTSEVNEALSSVRIALDSVRSVATTEGGEDG